VHGIYNLGAFIKKVEKLNGNKNSTIDDFKLQLLGPFWFNKDKYFNLIP